MAANEKLYERVLETIWMPGGLPCTDGSELHKRTGRMRTSRTSRRIWSKAEHESGILQFVRKEKRQRYEEQLRSAKWRPRFLERLPHFKEWEETCIVRLPGAAQTLAGILQRLQALGAPEQCHVIAADRALDGRSGSLEYLLGEVVALADGAVISCVPAELGYYEGEELKERFLLVRQ